ncbi:competence protein ComK [Bacillus sp. FJAT-50079]|uniref:competence protein ComK n=1 Tax=Bacillus sp. FJAT-50079 TaxID=2833577 RepID=UPI001BC98758|nr:competence protein ComK [Bacillus sp. FJAT-50079]MBS4206633.1 competence protein ComK [Bacillus sp. FJAT-50079]
MKMYEDYIIKPRTAALIPKFDTLGNPITQVIEETKSFLVKMTPLEVIKHSIIYYGNDYAGAKKASKLILGGVDMAPVQICGDLDMYWFPSHSPSKEHCIWFALTQIRDIMFQAKTETKVLLKFGHSITVVSSTKRFRKKIHLARELQTTLQNRKKEITYVSNKAPDGSFMIREYTPYTYHFIQSTREIKKINNTKRLYLIRG